MVVSGAAFWRAYAMHEPSTCRQEPSGRESKRGGPGRLPIPHPPHTGVPSSHVVNKIGVGAALDELVYSRPVAKLGCGNGRRRANLHEGTRSNFVSAVCRRCDARAGAPATRC